MFFIYISFDSKFQESLHISSNPFSAVQPSSSFAFCGSAYTPDADINIEEKATKR